MDTVFLATLASELEEIAGGYELQGTNAKLRLLELSLRIRRAALEELRTFQRAIEEGRVSPVVIGTGSGVQI